jgi:hypothetical protein
MPGNGMSAETNNGLTQTTAEINDTGFDNNELDKLYEFIQHNPELLGLDSSGKKIKLEAIHADNNQKANMNFELNSDKPRIIHDLDLKTTSEIKY